MGPRRPALLAVACGLALSGCGSDVAPADRHGEFREIVEWSLIGVGLDGRSLLVAPVSGRGACEYIRGRTRTDLVVRVGIDHVKCGAIPSRVYPSSLATVQVPALCFESRLRYKTDATYLGVVAQPEFSERVPGVVGLNLKTAREILQANGLRTVVRGSTDPDATIERQTPSAWLRRSTDRVMLVAQEDSATALDLGSCNR